MRALRAKEELERAAWEDERLNRRLTQLLSHLGERPQVSIPAACGGHSEMIAPYRFFRRLKLSLRALFLRCDRSRRPILFGDSVKRILVAIVTPWTHTHHEMSIHRKFRVG